MEKRIATFQIEDILPIGLTIIVLGIGLGYGLNVMGDVKEDMSDCNATFTYNESTALCQNATGTTYHPSVYGGAEFNATGDAMTGVGNLSSKLPLIVTVIVASIIIGILVRYLMVRYT